MNVLDLTTLSLVNGLLVVVCGVAFLIETLVRRSDVVGRLWSMFFIGLMFALFGYLVGSFVPSAWWAYPGANGAFVGGVGMIWAGARHANGRRMYLPAPIGAGIAVVVLGLIEGPGAGYWTGAVPLFAGIAAFSGLAAVEFSRGSLRRLPSARILGAVFILMTFYYSTRVVAFLVLGPEDPTFEAVYGASTSTLIETCLTVLGAMTLSAIQGDRFRRALMANADFGARVSIDGILVRETFQELAESWLMRSIRERRTMVMLLIEVADLAEVNVAFGRAAGDTALRTAGRLCLVHAPTAALIGHVSPRRFAILMELPTGDSVESIATRIADAVLATPIDDQDRFRASVFSGIATTRTEGARLQDLLRAATDAVKSEREQVHARVEDFRSGGILTGN